MIYDFLKEHKYLDLLKKYKTPDFSKEKLLEIFSKNMNCVKIKENEILFRIDDIGDKFYIILNGTVSILKPKRIKIHMSPFNFLKYLIQMKYENERYLIQMCIKSNYEKICFKNYEEFTIYEETSFKVKIREFFEIVQRTDFNDNQQIYQIFENFNRKITNYNILKVIFDKLEYKELKEYILKNENFHITEEEHELYNKYQKIFSDKEEYLYNIIEYHNILELYTGQPFGDFALDSTAKKRTATIKGKEDTVLGYISNEVYSKYILHETFKIRQTDLSFLNKENYIFQNIRDFIFEEIYFNKFGIFSYKMHEYIINQGDLADKIFILKEGEVDLFYDGSIYQANILLQNMINSCSEKELIDFKESGKLKSKYHNNKIFNIKSEKFLSKMNKPRKLHIMTVKAKEMLGLESIFLGIDHIYSAKIRSNKCQIFVLEKIIFDKIINFYSSCKKNFIEEAKNKFFTFLDRIYNVKSHKENKLIQLENNENDIIRAENIVRNHKEKLKRTNPIEIVNQGIVYPETFIQEEIKKKIQKPEVIKEEKIDDHSQSLVKNSISWLGFTKNFDNKKNKFDNKHNMFMTQADSKIEGNFNNKENRKSIEMEEKTNYGFKQWLSEKKYYELKINRDTYKNKNLSLNNIIKYEFKDEKKIPR